jgi:D-serine deaminase-like pyridoxal phosphate-dependent protein
VSGTTHLPTTPHSTVARNQLWARLSAAVEDSGPLPTPVMVVDLDAFDANAADLRARAGGTTIRVASKSLRVPALISRVLAHDGFAGVLGYTLAEALWLHEHDVAHDVVVAYPTVDVASVRRLLGSPAASGVTLMVDDVAHLDLVDAQRDAGTRGTEVRVAIDVDAGLQLGGQHVGPQRSPLHEVADVLALAREVVARPGFRLVGVMTYEGQVAGVPDDVPTQRARSLVVRRLKSLSLAQLATRRRAIADALAELVTLEFWNAGGSGSVQDTAADPVVTEVAAGSGLLVPTLFDHYRSFSPRPASFYGLPVTRRPSAQVATVHGGGLAASGAAGPDRAPTPWAPAGLHLTGLEGAGEVQTPLTGHPAALLAVGDLVWFRHAKSGEPFEHTTTVHLLSGARFVDHVPTYRGHGLAF